MGRQPRLLQLPPHPHRAPHTSPGSRGQPGHGTTPGMKGENPILHPQQRACRHEADQGMHKAPRAEDTLLLGPPHLPTPPAQPLPSSPFSQGPALHPLTHKQSQLGPGMSQQEVLIS